MRNQLIAAVVLSGFMLAASDGGIGSLRAGPRENWRKSFPAEVTGVAVAALTGEVVASTEEQVFLFRGSGDPAWTVGSGQGWKHVEGLGINRDASRIVFQTDLKPRQSTEDMNLAIHLLDGQGKELWQKPNPGRFESIMMSPTGKYLLTGEVFRPGLKFFDADLNRRWEKPLQFWCLRFDPTEKYLLDGEGGKLFTVEGAQVWDFGPWTRVLSVSDGAGYVMTQYFRTVRAAQSIFLSGRRELKKIELKGTGGCLSPDGSLAAYVSVSGKLQVFATSELLDAGESARPLFSMAFKKPWMMQIGRDNRTLLALGAESDERSALLLLDLAGRRVTWEKEVDPSLRTAFAPEDNREVTLQTDPRTLVNYRAW